MAREKSEIIAELKDLGATQAESTLKKKSVEKLEEMVDELKATQEDSQVEEVQEEEVQEPDKEEVTEEVKEESKEEVEVLAESKHQLGIFTEFIYHVKNVGSKVKVDNLGNGDVYADSKPVLVGDKSNRLTTGEGKVIEGASVVHLIAASQPEVKITELK